MSGSGRHKPAGAGTHGAGTHDAGTSLAELLVAAGLLGVVLVLVGSTVVSGLRSTAVARSKGSDAANGRVALDAITRTLRTAVDPDGDGSALRFERAEADAVTIYADLYNLADPTAAPVLSVPQKVAYEVAGGSLVETITPGLRQGSTGPVTWDPATARRRVLATGLVPASGRPAVFGYLDLQPTSTPPLVTLPGVGTPAGLSEDSRLDISLVDITLTLQEQSRVSRTPVTLLGRVGVFGARL